MAGYTRARRRAYHLPVSTLWRPRLTRSNDLTAAPNPHRYGLPTLSPSRPARAATFSPLKTSSSATFASTAEWVSILLQVPHERADPKIHTMAAESTSGRASTITRPRSGSWRKARSGSQAQTSASMPSTAEVKTCRFGSAHVTRTKRSESTTLSSHSRDGQ